MSKYRLKTKKEFIRDRLWEEKYNCPDKWALSGEMNKYLGKDIPDEFNVQCDDNEKVKYDGWLFENTDYVLKEQQEYFDDLSQHIGRYIRALVDYPTLGRWVKKGDVGKIINEDQADFPNSKGYYCSEALRNNYLGIKYELLPEDYSPEQKPSLEFIPGKWYKWYQKNHENYHYGKVKEINITTDTLVMTPWIMQCNNYNYSGSFDLSKAEQIQEISIEEIQEFLPKDHSDKISKSCINEVKNLKFKKGEYIVITDDYDNFSKSFVFNHIYKQRCNSNYLQSEYDSLNSTTNGWGRYTRSNTHNWRCATQEEIDEYERRGKPYDVTELQKKELSMEEIQEECKKRFPTGCTFMDTNEEDTHVIKTEIPEYVECVCYFGNEYTGKIYNTTVDKPEKTSTGTWYRILIAYRKLEDGSFKISNKEAYEQQKSLTHESVSGCFPTDKTMLIYDEVGQYPSISSDYWKNVPTFVEKEFDIYGPTPDIE